MSESQDALIRHLMADTDEGPPFFGESWPSGICETGWPVPTPVGAPCHLCEEAIVDGDQGTFMGHLSQDGPRAVPAHRECSLRSVMGGIGHLEDHLRWCLTEHDPDGGLSYRESALRVWAWVQIHGVHAS